MTFEMTLQIIFLAHYIWNTWQILNSLAHIVEVRSYCGERGMLEEVPLCRQKYDGFFHDGGRDNVTSSDLFHNIVRKVWQVDIQNHELLASFETMREYALSFSAHFIFKLITLHNCWLRPNSFICVLKFEINIY